MIIVGAKGFAKQIVEMFYQRNETNGIYFFDNVSDSAGSFYGHTVLKTLEDAKAVFVRDSRFCLGIGGPAVRARLACQLKELGGHLESVISPYAFLAAKACIKNGLCILTGAVIENDVIIEEGALVNTMASVHHDSVIGQYCEIAPGARILGGCVIEEFAFIGANAVILPGIQVGNNAVVGAGAIVTKDVKPYSLVVGNPARHVRYTNEG